MLDRKPGKKVRVEAIEILQRVRGGILRTETQVQYRIAQRQVEIDQQNTLLGLARGGDGKVRCDRCNARAAFRSPEHAKASIGLLGRSNSWPPYRGAHHGFAHRILRNRQRKKLAST